MWGICLDSKAGEDGLFQAVVQCKIDNSKALVMSPKANYELDIKKCLPHFMKNLRFFVNLWSCQPMQTPILRQHNSYFIIGCPFPPGNW